MKSEFLGPGPVRVHFDPLRHFARPRFRVGRKLSVPQASSAAAHEVYDPTSDTWTSRAPVPTPRDHLAAAVVNGRIYAIGGRISGSYGKPPKEHQFKKGKSGNLAGAPSKRKRKPIDVAGVLNEPLAVKSSGVRRKMPPFEVGVRRLVERGLKQNNLNAILEFLELCESVRLLVPPPVEHGGGVIVAPKGVNFHEWLDSVTEWGPAASPDADDDEFD